MPGRFVIDASVTLAWLFDEDQASARIESVLSGAEIVAPALWRLEVVNVVLIKERRKLLTTDEATRLLGLLDDWSVDIASDPAIRSLAEFAALARPHQLTAYDAVYLDLSLCLALPLFTRDNNLRAAAARVGVALVEESAP
jgi:predicted nucleic acid-binding protein